MNDQPLQQHRPAHTFTPQHAAAQNTAQPGHMQRPAGAYSPTQVQTPAYTTPAPAASQVAPEPVKAPTPTPPPVDTSQYTISVDDVRDRLRELNITKSKDTIQRYCRDGDLDCRKLGILNRYYTTEPSVEKLIEKMHPDAAAQDEPQAREGADAGARSDVQVQEAATERSEADSQDLHEAASATVQVDEPVDAGAPTRTQVHAGASVGEAAVLQAKLDAANARIEDQKHTIDFLMEEVKDSRGNRRDVTTIAERMLGTLEAMAIGGRLTERAKSEPTAAPVRDAGSPQQPEEGSRV